MAQASQLAHRQVLNPALPYDPYGSPIESDPQYLVGQNCMTSIAGVLERYPGFATALEATPTVFTGTLKRLFTWRKWGGSFITMACEITSNASRVYKLEVGVDASFVLIYTDSSSTTPFDFAVSNNTCYMGNATSATNMRKYSGSGSTTQLWGIVAPAAAVAISLSGTGIDGAAGYIYRVTYGNSTTAHESSPSAASANTSTFSNQQVNITLVASADSQVDQIHVYRTTDGGSTDPTRMQEISNSPFANTSTTVVDTTADTALLNSFAPALLINDPPQPSKGFITRVGRIWSFANNKVYFTGFEEIAKGVPEESMMSGIAGNFYPYANEVTALADAGDATAVFTPTTIFGISGDSLDTFRRGTLLNKRGARSVTNVVALGGTVAWLDTSSTVWINTDGEIGKGIRTDTASIDQTQTQMAVHISGNIHWLVLLDGANGKLFTYDLDLKQWLPPRVLPCKALCSGETSVGVVTLLAARNGTKVLKMTPNNYNDDGVTYAASATTNLYTICPDAWDPQLGRSNNPDLRGTLDHVSVETNTIQPTTVSVLTDDDPMFGTFTAIPKNPDNAVPLRTQGNSLLENNYPAKTLTNAARRVSIKFDWAAADSNFKIYGWFLAYQPVGK